jgi:hypothetical protein
VATLNFKINNGSGIPGDKVFIGFWGSNLDATVNGAPMKSIEDSTWYKLSEIESLVMQATTSGRIYVAYNDTFSPVNRGSLQSSPPAVPPMTSGSTSLNSPLMVHPTVWPT